MTKIRHHDKKVRHNVKSVSCRQNFHDIKTFVMTSMSVIYFKKLVMMSQTRQNTSMTSKTRRDVTRFVMTSDICQSSVS